MKTLNKTLSLVLGFVCAQALANGDAISGQQVERLLKATVTEKVVVPVAETAAATVAKKSIAEKASALAKSATEVVKAIPGTAVKVGCLVGDKVSSLLAPSIAPVAGSYTSAVLGYATVVAGYHVGKYAVNKIASYFETEEAKKARLAEETKAQKAYAKSSKLAKVGSALKTIGYTMFAPFVDAARLASYAFSSNDNTNGNDKKQKKVDDQPVVKEYTDGVIIINNQKVKIPGKYAPFLISKDAQSQFPHKANSKEFAEFAPIHNIVASNVAYDQVKALFNLNN